MLKQTDMEKLSVHNISKAYKGKRAVKDISFVVNNNEVVSLLGPNGAGKTTSFYMVVGLTNPDSGKIMLNDMDISNLAIHSRAKLGIGYLPQEPSIFRKLSVTDNIMAILELQPLSKKERLAKLQELIEEFGLSHVQEQQGISLSGGERRRVEIARALAATPKFILLDEPFAGIDPIAIIDTKAIIKKLKEKNIGILITDHNVRETLDICDRAYIVNNGEIIASGAPEQVQQDPRVIKSYLGEQYDL